jgi:hypothetical protein
VCIIFPLPHSVEASGTADLQGTGSRGWLKAVNWLLQACYKSTTREVPQHGALLQHNELTVRGLEQAISSAISACFTVNIF